MKTEITPKEIAKSRVRRLEEFVEKELDDNEQAGMKKKYRRYMESLNRYENSRQFGERSAKELIMALCEFLDKAEHGEIK